LKLWDKGIELNKLVEDFTVGDDYILDRSFLYYDCIASIAHAKTLEKAGILSGEEREKLITTLEEIKEKGLEIKKEDEDVHTAIEKYLCNKLGDTGKKIHTGRSRNDQIMADIQLWCRDEMDKIKDSVISLCETMNDFSRENPALMPGYTHMQKAMPSSVPLLCGSYIEGLLDGLLLLNTAYHINNVSPLGSAAGYGSLLNLDRDYTAKLLGFRGVRNCIYVQNRSGLMSIIIYPLSCFMRALDKMASDLLLFTMDEFRFFSLPDEFCTGSSIMPQKKNYDILELIRGKASVVESLLYRIELTGNKLISGYNRDYQLSKGPLLESFGITLKSLRVMDMVFKNLKVNKSAMEKAITAEIFATDKAYELVKNGVPFREAYNMVAANLEELQVPQDIFKGRDFLKFRDYKVDIDKFKKFTGQ